MAALQTAIQSSFLSLGTATLQIVSNTGFASYMLVYSEARMPIIVMQSAAVAVASNWVAAATLSPAERTP